MNKKGFTLAELLIVVAIIAVLVGISIPVFSSQLEKSREAKDLANVRSAYSQVMTALLSGEKEGVNFDETNGYSLEVDLSQNIYDWQTTGLISIGGVNSNDEQHWIGKPGKGGKCVISINEDETIPTLVWSGETDSSEPVENYPKQLVQESAKKYEAAINDVIKTVYNELVLPRLGGEEGQVSYVRIEQDGSMSVCVYTKSGSATSITSSIDIKELYQKISSSLEEEGFKIIGQTKLFLDKDGNFISNFDENGNSLKIAGQGNGSCTKVKNLKTGEYDYIYFKDNLAGWYIGDSKGNPKN